MPESTHVFIPTRGRPHLLDKTADKWQAQKDVEVHLVIDPSTKELKSYRHLPFDIITLPERSMGMGRIRQHILKVGEDLGLEAIVMADDDSYPAKGHVRDLTRTVLEKGVIGCGASNSYHGLMIGNEVLNMKTRFPVAGGYGHIMFAINIAEAMDVGGYPEWATAWGEDTELQREGIKEGMPWWYSTYVQMGSVAKRYSPGGLASQYKGDKREREERKCHEQIYKRWPNYVSHPDTGRFRCYWKRMMGDYCPGWQRQVPPRVRRALNLA